VRREAGVTQGPLSESELAAAYAAARPRLVGIGYAVLGSRAEAEDVVSECWLRLVASNEREPIRDPEAWATVVVARAALDVLRSARLRRESYVGPWLPEPVVSLVTDPAPPDPADRVTFDESVSYALLVVLESLSPAERTAWVLHDLFAVPFPEVADAVGRSPDAVRQLAARARTHISTGRGRVAVDRAQHRAAVAAFQHATLSGDVAGLLRVLDPGVVLTSDGGGQVSAALRPVLGADKVSRFLLGLLGKRQPGQAVRPAIVNGLSGYVFTEHDRVVTVASFTVADDRIVRIDLVRAPDKLVAVPGYYPI
jgi:RNA polymerase sigma-70 factor, ECF subfamily